MAYCKNCGNQLAETAKFCSKCRQQIFIQEKKLKPKWSLEKFLIDNPPNEKGVIKCPRCLGKSHVEKKDITRLGMDGLLLVGDCQYCDGVGLVNIKKIDSVPIDFVAVDTDIKQQTINMSQEESNYDPKINTENKQINIENPNSEFTLNCDYEKLISLIEQDSLLIVKSQKKDYEPKNGTIKTDIINNENILLSWIESNPFGKVSCELKFQRLSNKTTIIKLSRNLTKVKINATILLTIAIFFKSGMEMASLGGGFLLTGIAFWVILPLVTNFQTKRRTKLLLSNVEKMINNNK